MNTITVNGAEVDITASPTPELAAIHELLHQRAKAMGLAADAMTDSEVDSAIERVLTEEVDVPEPTEEECRHWYDANRERFVTGQLVYARHILFQITPGAPVPAIRDKAETTLREIRRHPELFETRAKDLSNCPSGATGGQLGQLQRGETVPEFEKVLFDGKATGVMPNLIKTRYGFHIVAIDKRIEGRQLPFEFVRDQVTARLRRYAEERALRQYVQLLAGHADIQGIELGGSVSPLVQ